MSEEQESSAPKNTVTIEQAGPCKKKVIVEIPREAIRVATDEQYKTLRKEAMVPGFRPGRAPLRLLEKRFGKEVTEKVKLKLLADAGESAVKDNELNILREPDIDFEKIELPADGPLKFDFEVEVRPQFELPPLEGIPVEKRKLEVTDEQISREIEQLQRWSGMWVPREDGQIQPDDQIIADAILKTEEDQEQKLDNIEIYVRRNGFVGPVPVEKLDELLTGASAGESKQTTVEIPKTYFKEEYRGKKVDVQIHVKDVKWLKPAALDEDFLKKVGADNENEMRERLRDTLQSRLETQVRTEMTEQIYKYMLDNIDFELPVDIVADQATTLLQRQYSNLIRQGLARQQIEEQTRQLQAASEQQAKQQLKTFFIMDKIAEELKIEVSDEEINGYIARLAIQQGQRPERMRQQLDRDGTLPQFKLQVREDMCIAKLLETAKITDVKPKKKAKKQEKPVRKPPKKSPKKNNLPRKKQPVERKTTAKKKTGN